MPHFDIVKKSQPSETFRVKSVMGSYDMTASHTQEHFVGEINLPDQWNIGLIVGRSGTGKTTIARHLFGDCIVSGYEYTHESILDDMPEGASVSEISQALTSVGFASPPSWLKPYAVLSNGEKMRCDLARAILEKRDMFVFDEFTSVVDRTVAKVGSLAIQKAIRRGGAEIHRGNVSRGCRTVAHARLGIQHRHDDLLHERLGGAKKKSASHPS